MTSKQATEAQEQLGIVPEAAKVFGKALDGFTQLVDEREGCREIEKQAKESRGYSEGGRRVVGLDDRIKDMLADIKAVLLPDGRKVQVVEKAGNEYVDVRLLLEAGVPADTIAKCKRRGASSWYILVSGKK